MSQLKIDFKSDTRKKENNLSPITRRQASDMNDLRTM